MAPVKALLVVVVLLAGCASHARTTVDVGSATSQGGVHAHIEGGRGLAVLFGLSILAAGIVETERERYSTRPFLTISESNPRYAPEMAADRKVSEQDCTKPIDYTLGNIRCK
jgi:hypothetical protein